MDFVIYLELDSSTVQNVVTALSDKINVVESSEKYYKDKYEKLTADVAKLKADLAQAQNWKEAAEAAETEKEAL